MRDIIISILVILLVVSGVLFLLFDMQKNNEKEELISKVELVVSEYKREKKKLESELDVLEKTHYYETVGLSRLILCFNEIDDNFTEKILPILEENEVPALICLSKENLPGQNTLFSFEDFNTLISEGWQSALYFNSDKGISEWYNEAVNVFNNSNIPVPNVVIVDETLYSTPLAYELFSKGFSDIIIKAEKPDIFREDLSDGPVLTDAVGWLTYVAVDIIDSFASRVGDAVFIIGGDDPYEIYDEEQFEKMLNNVFKAAEDKQLIFTTPEKMSEYKKTLSEVYEDTIEEYTMKTNEINQKIALVNEKIDNVYKEYFNEE